jgi:hypothetical protein
VPRRAPIPAPSQVQLTNVKAQQSKESRSDTPSRNSPNVGLTTTPPSLAVLYDMPRHRSHACQLKFWDFVPLSTHHTQSEEGMCSCPWSPVFRISGDVLRKLRFNPMAGCQGQFDGMARSLPNIRMPTIIPSFGVLLASNLSLKYSQWSIVIPLEMMPLLRPRSNSQS